MFRADGTRVILASAKLRLIPIGRCRYGDKSFCSRTVEEGPLSTGSITQAGGAGGSGHATANGWICGDCD
jgi:hypothetical protein